MAEEKNNFKSTLESLFRGMDGVVSSKTVVGDAIHIGGTIILPLVDVSFGIGAGAFSGDKKEKGMGGIGGRMTPSAVIVIQDGKTRLVNIKNQDTITKILDMVPDVIDRFLALASTRIDPEADSGPREDLSADSVTENFDMVSEELAEIYAAQGLFCEARKIYERLSLLYPEKSVYFAKIIAGMEDRNVRSATTKKKV